MIGRGEHDLRTLLRNCDPILHPDEFMFVLIPMNEIPAGLKPHASCREVEGMTLIMKRDDAERSGFLTMFCCRMISLNVHSALDAVGFLPPVLAALAARGIPANVVAGCYHDHLFVPTSRANEALQALHELAAKQ
jgi:hypothetical protein